MQKCSHSALVSPVFHVRNSWTRTVFRLLFLILFFSLCWGASLTELHASFCIQEVVQILQTQPSGNFHLSNWSKLWWIILSKILLIEAMYLLINFKVIGFIVESFSYWGLRMFPKHLISYFIEIFCDLNFNNSINATKVFKWRQNFSHCRMSLWPEFIGIIYFNQILWNYLFILW